MPRPVSIQNAFCLLDGSFAFELAEACACRNYNIGLLPWYILAGGILNGKYDGKIDRDIGHVDDDGLEISRCGLFRVYQWDRFRSQLCLEATAECKELAEANNMSTATLAQAFCKWRWYISSSIIGATNLKQLKEKHSCLRS